MKLYSIQTFENNSLSQTLWINAVTGEMQPPDFIPSNDDVIVSGAIDNIPDWQGWNEFIFQDVAYNQMIRVATDQRSITRLEALSLRRFFQDEMIIFWNSFIKSVPAQSKPALADIEVWRSAVEFYAMPFNFSDDGLMIAKQGA